MYCKAIKKNNNDQSVTDLRDVQLRKRAKVIIDYLDLFIDRVYAVRIDNVSRENFDSQSFSGSLIYHGYTIAKFSFIKPSRIYNNDKVGHTVKLSPLTLYESCIEEFIRYISNIGMENITVGDYLFRMSETRLKIDKIKVLLKNNIVYTTVRSNEGLYETCNVNKMDQDDYSDYIPSVSVMNMLGVELLFNGCINHVDRIATGS